MTQLVDHAGRTVNHLATFYQPGEQHLAVKVYQALGCRVSNTTFGEGNQGLVIHVEPDEDDLVNNVIYAAEATPVQWQFEEELRGALGEREALARAFATYSAQRESQPESVTHFGIRYTSFAKFEAGTDAPGRAPRPRPPRTTKGRPGLQSAGGHVLPDRGRDLCLCGHRCDCRGSADTWPDHRAASPAAGQ